MSGKAGADPSYVYDSPESNQVNLKKLSSTSNDSKGGNYVQTTDNPHFASSNASNSGRSRAGRSRIITTAEKKFTSDKNDGQSAADGSMEGSSAPMQDKINNSAYDATMAQAKKKNKQILMVSESKEDE